MNEDFIDDNKVYLQGVIASEITFSHQLNNEDFYQFEMEVSRLSNVSDLIPVAISSKLKDIYQLKKGGKIALQGQFRSYNKLEDGKSRLVLRVFCRGIEDYDFEQNSNTIELNGYICKKPIYRVTPFSREICDVLVAVNRNYGKSDYIPCIAWGRNAQFVQNLPIGSKINLIGRIQSREYSKKLEGVEQPIIKTAYEVSASNINLIKTEQTV